VEVLHLDHYQRLCRRDFRRWSARIWNLVIVMRNLQSGEYKKGPIFAGCIRDFRRWRAHYLRNGDVATWLDKTRRRSLGSWNSQVTLDFRRWFGIYLRNTTWQARITICGFRRWERGFSQVDWSQPAKRLAKIRKKNFFGYFQEIE